MTVIFLKEESFPQIPHHLQQPQLNKPPMLKLQLQPMLQQQLLKQLRLQLRQLLRQILQVPPPLKHQVIPLHAKMGTF